MKCLGQNSCHALNQCKETTDYTCQILLTKECKDANNFCYEIVVNEDKCILSTNNSCLSISGINGNKYC
jgi:hypothetical protein